MPRRRAARRAGRPPPLSETGELTFASNEGNLPPSALRTVRLEVSSARRKHAGGHAETIGEAARPMTAYLLEALPGPVLALVCVLVFVGYAVAVTAIGRRLVPLVGRGHNEVGSVVLRYRRRRLRRPVGLRRDRTVGAPCRRRRSRCQRSERSDRRLPRCARPRGAWPHRRAGRAHQICPGRHRPRVPGSSRRVPERDLTPGIHRRVYRSTELFAGRTPPRMPGTASCSAASKASAERALRIGGVSGSLPNVFWVVLLVQTLLMLGLGDGLDGARQAPPHLSGSIRRGRGAAALPGRRDSDRPFSGDYALGPEPFEQRSTRSRPFFTSAATNRRAQWLQCWTDDAEHVFELGRLFESPTRAVAQPSSARRSSPSMR